MSSIALNSKISIITKSDVRYEGWLNRVDSAGNKIILANVKIFGTEDRGGRAVPPFNKVLDYRNFHEVNIKDFRVVSNAQSEEPASPQNMEANNMQPSAAPKAKTKKHKNKKRNHTK